VWKCLHISMFVKHIQPLHAPLSSLACFILSDSVGLTSKYASVEMSARLFPECLLFELSIFSVVGIPVQLTPQRYNV